MKIIIPFDINYRPQIESGEYKLIYDDKKGGVHSARIVCWDMQCSKYAIQSPILALVSVNDTYEYPVIFKEDGNDVEERGSLCIDAENAAGDKSAVFDFQKRFEELIKEGERLIEKLKASR